MTTINGSTYLHELTQDQEHAVLLVIESKLEAEGLQGEELAEAVENADNSKISDLNELITLAEVITIIEGVNAK